jgi:DNA invertase Pin-like site-specific DNA recombinase
VLRVSQNVVSKRVGYMRVSTSEQTNEQQQDALVAAGCEVIHGDNGISGSVRDRAGLKAALADCGPGDTLVVVALDRLGRDLSDLVNIMKELKERNVNIRTLNGEIDTSSAQGEMVFAIFGALAQYERALIRERTKARLASKKVRGERVGRKPALTPSQVKDARVLLADGRSSAQVAKSLGCSRATLYRHLGAVEVAA